MIFWTLWRWARRRRRRKSAAWIKRRYFMQPGESRWRFRGTLTNEEGKVYRVFLKSARPTAIRRHVKIKGEANPYDPS